LHQLIAGFGPDEFDANRRFLLGVQYADGRRTVAADMPGAHTSESSADDHQALSLALGSGSGQHLRSAVLVVSASTARAGHHGVSVPETPEEQAPAPPTTLLPDSGWFAGQD